ncbi:MAG TPA: hypothetical protein VD997_03600 [Phycisphaerales bacterium]|nr:hypothetical protein [Phycisphaerales bacterium]
MITPSPTSKIDPALARGELLGSTSSHIVFGVPNTSYQLHLVPTSPISTPVGKRLVGTIRVQARRIDVVGTGGQFVEPVFGRPRRVQGTVVRVEGGAVVVDAGVPIHAVPTDSRQRAEQFEVGQMVSFDAVAGGTFTVQ